MKSKLLDSGAQKTYAVILDTGDEVTANLLRFAEDQELSAAAFTGLGAFSDVVLGYFDMRKKEYQPIRIDEQVEVVSFVGNVALAGGKPRLHPHVVVARHDGRAYGGHLLQAHVRPTLEVVFTESPRFLQRITDKATGLPLIAIEDS